MTSTDFLIYTGIAVAALLILYVFIQWTHQIHKRNRYLKAQTQLLGKIALQQGVGKDEVNTILAVAERPDSII